MASFFTEPRHDRPALTLYPTTGFNLRVMRIGELARQAGVNIQTVRFYERKGLLPAPRRKPSGYRLYTDEDLHRLRFIRRAKALGFSLEEIREVLHMRAEGGPADRALCGVDAHGGLRGSQCPSSRTHSLPLCLVSLDSAEHLISLLRSSRWRHLPRTG